MYGVECRRQYKREERVVDSIYLHTTKPGVFIPPVARLSTFPSSFFLFQIFASFPSRSGCGSGPTHDPTTPSLRNHHATTSEEN
jgi:hypothetical protein